MQGLVDPLELARFVKVYCAAFCCEKSVRVAPVTKPPPLESLPTEARTSQAVAVEIAASPWPRTDSPSRIRKSEKWIRRRIIGPIERRARPIPRKEKRRRWRRYRSYRPG